MRLEDFIYDSSLVLYLPLWKKDGSAFMSDDAYGHTCTVTGALWTPQGRSLDGLDDRISIGAPAALNFGAGSYTVGVWAYYTTAANDKPYFNSEDAVGRRRLNLRSSAFSREATAGGIFEKTFTAPTANNWHHVFGVYDSVAQTLEPFVDAVSQGTTGSVTGTLAVATDNELGYWTALAFKFAGTLGEAWAFSRAFSFIEIQRHYQATKGRCRKCLL